MITCPNCGKEINGDSAFCRFCGKEVLSDVSSNAAEYSLEYHVDENTEALTNKELMMRIENENRARKGLSPIEPKKKANKKRIIIISAVVIVIISIISCVFISLLNNNNNSLTEYSVTASEARYVASENSKKYHRPDCRFAQQIKSENKVYYRSESDAEKGGKFPCKTCKP